MSNKSLKKNVDPVTLSELESLEWNDSNLTGIKTS